MISRQRNLEIVGMVQERVPPFGPIYSDKIAKCWNFARTQFPRTSADDNSSQWHRYWVKLWPVGRSSA